MFLAGLLPQPHPTPQPEDAHIPPVLQSFDKSRKLQDQTHEEFKTFHHLALAYLLVSPGMASPDHSPFHSRHPLTSV